MHCRVCGYNGEFETRTLLAEIDVDYSGSCDDNGNYNERVIEDLKYHVQSLHVCPNCRIVYAFNE